MGRCDRRALRNTATIKAKNRATNERYSHIVSGLPPDTYLFTVLAQSTVTGTFNHWRTVSVTVQANPAMSLDSPAAGAIVGLPFGLTGWAIDRAAASGTGVDAIHVWAYPHSGAPAQFWGAATFAPLPDIAALYGAQFSKYGLTVTSAAPGTYTVVVYAHSTVTGTFSDSRTVVITVQ